MPHAPVLLLLLLALPGATQQASAAAATCAREQFPAGRAYASCEDLLKLGASIHWTHDVSRGSLSVAFVAAPTAGGGWVAWGLNPTGEGMAGTQVLVALSGGSPTVRTYNITGTSRLASPPTASTSQSRGGRDARESLRSAEK